MTSYILFVLLLEEEISYDDAYKQTELWIVPIVGSY